MTIGSFQELIATILLMVIPDPVVWVVLFLLGLVFGIVITKTNGTTAVLVLFLAIHSLTNAIGGIMNMIMMIMYVALGFSVVLALIKIGNR